LISIKGEAAAAAAGKGTWGAATGEGSAVADPLLGAAAELALPLLFADAPPPPPALTPPNRAAAIFSFSVGARGASGARGADG
jgi:hypothetical protein